MRLKSQGNIDKEANLPDGIEFRQDLIWDQIQKKQSKKRPFFWWIATACLLLGIANMFYPSHDEEAVRLAIIAQNRPLEPKIDPSPEVIPKLEDLQESAVKVVEIEGRKLISPLVAEKEYPTFMDSIPGFELPLVLTPIAIKPIIAIIPQIEDNPTQELSPAALRLQKSLQKLDPNKSAGQILIVEKFNLLKEFTIYQSQSASGSQQPTSIFQLPKKNRNENN